MTAVAKRASENASCRERFAQQELFALCVTHAYVVVKAFQHLPKLKSVEEA